MNLSFQLTPSRRATEGNCDLKCGRCISTHALTEGDYASPAVKESYIKFQLTPSRRATIADDQVRVVLLFQLTPSRRATHENHLPLRMVIFQLTPSRRATILSRIVERKWKDFNSRPHGGRLQCNRIFFSHGKISTHALTEGDAAGFSTSYPCFSFQLTPSRRATSGRDFADHNADISTHALTEGDFTRCGQAGSTRISTHALTEGDALRSS